MCHEHDAFLYVDATASIVGMPLPVDAWEVDACTAGLQKCLAGPSGVAPITLGDRFAAAIYRRRHIEEGVRPPGFVPGEGPTIASNYFDLAMIMDYWGEMALNHHTEATTMLYGARECARITLQEGLPNVHRRHALASRAMVAGLQGMGLRLFGDLAHKMPNVTGVWIPDGVDGNRVRARMLEDFNIEIGTSFGPLHGKVWRIGTMGYNARKDAVLVTLGALDAVLAGEGCRLPRGAGVDAACDVYRSAEAGAGAK
jgi:(S)-ureidoglycine-glyoxylate aminotransferase